jgi:hypothetical protein
MRTFTRREALKAGLGGGSTALSGLSGCLRPPAAGGDALVSESFESDLEPWMARATIGPEVPAEEFEWRVSRSRRRARTGEWSLKVFTEGDHDDGTAWAIRPIEIGSPGARTASFSVSAHAWSPSESFNTLRHFVMYLGPTPPRSEADFPEPGGNSTGVAGAEAGGLREPLHQVEGWREYAFEWTPDRLTTDRLYLAVGVSVVWESDATHFLDDVRVEAGGE